MQFQYKFASKSYDPIDSPNMHWREKIITKENEEKVTVSAPITWSDTAINVAVTNYIRKIGGKWESGIKDIYKRIPETLMEAGIKNGYFDKENGLIYKRELQYLLLNQFFAFNSPVQFNLGVQKEPQIHACFILGIEDTLLDGEGSMMNIQRLETEIFKGGSGVGINFSKIRGSGEPLSNGGVASGPISFMLGMDRWAASMKSGGATRRAAKMAVLDVDHPDIEEFIEFKAIEEKKAKDLIDAGWPNDWEDIVYKYLAGQNQNNSVMVTDEFMQAVKSDSDWELKWRTDPSITKKIKASKLFDMIVQANYDCADPGLLFYDTINKFNTTPQSGTIVNPNPCAEYLSVPNSACNLASINLIKFIDDKGEFLVESFKHTVRIMMVSTDILTSISKLPNKTIDHNVKTLRDVGLGETNLGATLMSLALPYDSDEGRNWAINATALLQGCAILTSIEMAKELGPFEAYPENKKDMLKVIYEYCNEASQLNTVQEDLNTEIQSIWLKIRSEGKKHGFRNARFTAIAPTGTIGLLMDCDTTSTEPDFALIKTKRIVGGKTINQENKSVKTALRRLGYNSDSIEEILKYLKEKETLKGVPYLSPSHLSIFDCSMEQPTGKAISYMGHLKMLSAIQKFVSMGISKTVNLPHNATKDDIANVLMKSWEMGIKSVSVYRDGCKGSQPLMAAGQKLSKSPTKFVKKFEPPRERDAKIKKFSIGVNKGYITIGTYEDGYPSDIFIQMSNVGSTLNGFVSIVGILTSTLLQHGISWETIVSKLQMVQFEPAGIVHEKDEPGRARIVTSISDYLGQLLKEMCENYDEKHNTNKECIKEENLFTGQFCECGGTLRCSGTCFYCDKCGKTTGCS